MEAEKVAASAPGSGPGWAAPAGSAGLAALLAWIAVPAPATAQIMPSERASVSQTVDGTTIALDYARPRVRGRDLFGGLVPWGQVWTPGANDATVLELSRGVTIEGHEVPAGRWSVWMVVNEEEPWEVVLDPRDDLWHTVHPGPTDQQVRFAVEPGTGPPAEALLWYFPEVRRSGATLVMAWGPMRVPLEIEVEPTYRYTMGADEAAPFLGAWTMERTGGQNAGQERHVEVVHAPDGSLRLVERAEGAAPLEWVLQPKADGVFALGWTRDGELWSGSQMFLEMTYENGRPVAFTVRSPRDEIIWNGRRHGLSLDPTGSLPPG